ncbi:response regulator transcription factor [Martelella alba]|uniref:Response regulator transcription factor n=1 Tax=Martelella alba TaxID=2590451 RepID=A0A506U6J2_9HYPH|nr:response regulator transcription factor [Martelella alba]TPW30012.1 response regulator transcription factor [Martelella alba]
MKALLIEDDDLVGDAIQRGLALDHAQVEWVRDGTEGEAVLRAGGYDLVLLDLGLPGTDGLDILRALRGRGDHVPVLILTARDGVADRIRGLDLGADDYVLKPFDMDELRARARALARRATGRLNDVISCDGLIIDLQAHSAILDGEALALPGQEFRLLIYLAEQRGRVVSKEQIADMLYGWGEGAESNTIEVLVSSLRRKIGAQRIRTLRGVGYMMP